MYLCDKGIHFVSLSSIYNFDIWFQNCFKIVVFFFSFFFLHTTRQGLLLKLRNTFCICIQLRLDRFAQNKDNVSEWGDMSVSMRQHYKNPTKRVDLVQSGHHHIISVREKKLVFAMLQLKNCRVEVKQQSLTHK